MNIKKMLEQTIVSTFILASLNSAILYAANDSDANENKTCMVKKKLVDDSLCKDRYFPESEATHENIRKIIKTVNDTELTYYKPIKLTDDDKKKNSEKAQEIFAYEKYIEATTREKVPLGERYARIERMSNFEKKIEPAASMRDYNEGTKYYTKYIFKIKAKDVLDKQNPNSTTFFTYSYYESKIHNDVFQNGKRPLVIVFTTIMGIGVVEDGTADAFAKAGFDVIVTPPDDNVADPYSPYLAMPRQMNDVLIKQITGARYAIDYVENNLSNRIDKNRIAAFGASLGGMRAGTLLGIDNRVNSVVMLAAGGNFPYILSFSEQKLVKDFKLQKMKELGMKTSEEYYDSIKEASVSDPLLYAHNRSPDDVYMVIAANDRKIYTANQIELWLAFGKPEYYIVSCGGLMTYLLNCHVEAATHTSLNWDDKVLNKVLNFLYTKMDIPLKLKE